MISIAVTDCSFLECEDEVATVVPTLEAFTLNDREEQEKA